MLGVIVAYPGTETRRFTQVHPGLHFSDDGFGIGFMPTLTPDKRIVTYSNKTIVLVEAPEIVLWRLWRTYFPERQAQTFLTSFIDGAQRYNFFLAIWLKLSEVKGIKFVNSANTARFRKIFIDTFDEMPLGEIPPYPLMLPKWDDHSKNIIAGMCPNWEIVNGRS